MKTKDEILTEIMLNKEHLDFVRTKLDESDDKDSNFLSLEYDKTFKEIERLKREYEYAPAKTFTGQIVIDFNEADDTMRWECYRLLNNLYSESNGAVNYVTNLPEDTKYSLYESESFSPTGEKYSKDFNK